jgi:hypothetical protein
MLSPSIQWPFVLSLSKETATFPHDRPVEASNCQVTGAVYYLDLPFDKPFDLAQDKHREDSKQAK